MVESRIPTFTNCGGPVPLPKTSSIMEAFLTKHVKKQEPVPSTLVGDPPVSSIQHLNLLFLIDSVLFVLVKLF